MHDFVKTYSGKAASTEDFKAAVEKHMTDDMDLDGNRRLDWFFDEYVYGTALPAYKFSGTFGKDGNGDVVLNMKMTQSGVEKTFQMIIPIYLELADGRIVFMGRAHLTGASSVEQSVPLKGLKETPTRAFINYNYDVLAAE